MKFYVFCCRFISYLMIIILSVLTFFSLISTTFVNSFDQVYYTGDIAFIHAISVTALIALLCVAYQKLKFRVTDRIIVLTLAFITILMAAYIGITNLSPRFDQGAVRAVAGNLMVGILDDFAPGGYAEIYPYNHGIILFYRMVLGLAGYENYIVISYINLVFMVLTVTALYLIMKRVFPYYRECTLGLILFMPYWGYSTFMYGNIPGFCFGMWGLYLSILFLEEYKIYEAILAGMLFAVCFRFKEHFAILMIATLIMTICEMIKCKNIKGTVLIISMLCFMLLANLTIDRTLMVIADYKPSKGIPSLPYVAMGLHEHETRGAGWHDNYPETTYEEIGHDIDVSNQLAKEDIRASINNFITHPTYAAGFFVRKIASMWNDPTYYSWTLQQRRDERLDSVFFLPGIFIVYTVFNLCQTYLYLFALIYFVSHRKENDLIKLLFALYFIGGFLCHLLWEAASQYALFYAMGLAVYAVMGMIDVCRAVGGWDRDKKIKAATAVMGIGIILSIPQISALLTLSRDNARYAEYMIKPY